MSPCFLQSNEPACPSRPRQHLRVSPGSSPGHRLVPKDLQHLVHPFGSAAASRPITQGWWWDPLHRPARGVLSTQAAPPPAPRSPRPDPGMGRWGGSRSLKPFGPSQPLGKLFLMQLFCRQDQKGFAMGGGWLIFYQVTWKITFWQGSTSRTPIRSLVGRNQEQHLIPMEMPGGITPESETLWHEETPQHTIPLGLLVQHVGKNSEETRDLGHPRTCSPLQPQLWVLLNTPFPPKTKPPHHSFRSQPQLPVERPWDMGGDKAAPSSLSFRDGLSSLAEFCSRLPEILCPRLGAWGFSGATLAINAYKSVRTNQCWLAL